ncbi:MAG: pentapeptide repeat-containing protein, partial [Massilimaliae sp.]|nr:pentapeptide repeat-containing protein [Massiliimalia sp.]
MFIKEVKQYRRHDFTGEMLQDLELNGYEFYECNFRGVNLSQLVTRGCIFDHCDFSFARMSGSKHKNSAFVNCKFYSAVLFCATFTDCKATGSIFTDADLT